MILDLLGQLALQNAAALRPGLTGRNIGRVNH